MPNIATVLDTLYNNNNNTKISMCKTCLEDFIICNDTHIYGLTLTLNPKKHIKIDKVSKPIKDWNNSLILSHIKSNIYKSKLWKVDNIKYIIFLEKHKSGVPHFHAIIRGIYPVLLNRIVRKWRREYGHVKVEKELRSVEAWSNYIGKDNNMFINN